MPIVAKKLYSQARFELRIARPCATRTETERLAVKLTRFLRLASQPHRRTTPPRRRMWLSSILLGAGLSLSPATSEVFGQERVFPAFDLPENGRGASIASSPDPAVSMFGEPAACFDPVSLTPNFFGSFVGRGSEAAAPLIYSGIGAEGGGTFIVAPVVVNGPGGPFNLATDIPFTPLPGFTISLAENAELTPQVLGAFAGAAFDNGAGTASAGTVNFNYTYLLNVNLPNPAGGGFVGRNQFFDYGSALTQDRVFFVYDHIGDVRGLGSRFDVNRYLFGVERSFLDGRASIDVRVPFAGTVNNSQVLGQSLSTGEAEFGNVGFALKWQAVRTSTLAVCAGLGFSTPTASDTRLVAGGTPLVAIENQAWLLQPLIGVAYAPGGSFYSQFAAQFDFDPVGNPVLVSNGVGGLRRIGKLHDSNYAFLNGSVGWWLTQSETANGIRGVALQGDLHYDTSMGSRDVARSGNVSVSDQNGNFHSLNATVGTYYRHNGRSELGVGVSLPLDGFYDWSVMAQVNLRLGRRS